MLVSEILKWAQDKGIKLPKVLEQALQNDILFNGNNETAYEKKKRQIIQTKNIISQKINGNNEIRINWQQIDNFTKENFFYIVEKLNNDWLIIDYSQNKDIKNILKTENIKWRQGAKTTNILSKIFPDFFKLG